MPLVWRSSLPIGGKLVASLCLANCVFGPLVGVIVIAGAIDLLLAPGAGFATWVLTAVAALEIAFAMTGMILAQRLIYGTSTSHVLPRAVAGIAVLLCAQLAGASSFLDLARGKTSVWTSTPKKGSQRTVDSRRLAPAPSGEHPSE
jgi:uncharacterized membrane protein